MARITKTTDLLNGLTQTEENRTARVVIEARTDGTVGMVFERETVVRINGQIVGGPKPCSPVVLSDAQIRAIPAFAIVYNAMSQAGDGAEQAMVDATAAAIAAEAAAEAAAATRAAAEVAAEQGA